MKKNKTSLFNALKLKSIFTMDFKNGLKELWKQSSEDAKDERILNENNKIYSIIFNLLVVSILLASILIDKISINLIIILISIINYIGLIITCKKNIVESNPCALNFFFWSFILMPIYLFNLSSFSIINFIIIIIAITILYTIANIIYKTNAN